MLSASGPSQAGLRFQGQAHSQPVAKKISAYMTAEISAPFNDAAAATFGAGRLLSAIVAVRLCSPLRFMAPCPQTPGRLIHETLHEAVAGLKTQSAGRLGKLWSVSRRPSEITGGKMEEQAIWALEERFWLEGSSVYDDLLDPACHMAFPDMGVMRAADVLDTLKHAPRWTSVEMTGRSVGRAGDTVIVLGYTADGRRDGSARPPTAPTRNAGCWSSTSRPWWVDTIPVL